MNLDVIWGTSAYYTETGPSSSEGERGNWWRVMAIGSAKASGTSGPSHFALTVVSVDGLVAEKKVVDFPNGGHDAATPVSKNFKDDQADLLWRLIVGSHWQTSF